MIYSSRKKGKNANYKTFVLLVCLCIMTLSERMFHYLFHFFNGIMLMSVLFVMRGKILLCASSFHVCIATYRSISVLL